MMFPTAILPEAFSYYLLHYSCPRPMLNFVSHDLHLPGHIAHRVHEQQQEQGNSTDNLMSPPPPLPIPNDFPFPACARTDRRLATVVRERQVK